MLRLPMAIGTFLSVFTFITKGAETTPSISAGPFMLSRRHIMPTVDTGDWHELFDVALFEPNKSKLRQRIEHARHAISNRLEALMKDQNDERYRSIL